jgi:lipopolysaccharide transport system permease protein
MTFETPRDGLPMNDVQSCPVPHYSIRAGAKRGPIDFGELAQYSDLLLNLALRDVKVRYKQTALGVLWVVLQPLLAALIFSFVFGLVARMPSGGRPYVLFAFAGLLVWNTFANALNRSASALLNNSYIVTKVYFPRIVLPLSSIASVLLDFSVSLGVMLIMLAAYRVWPGAGILLLPVWLTIIVAMGLGFGLMAGAMTVRFRDFYHLIPTVLQLGLYISPVFWPASAVPARYRLIYLLNPIAGPLEAFRWSLFGEGTLSAFSLIYASAVAALALWGGTRIFRQMERSFADVI